MYISRIQVKLDRNAFRSATEVGFWPVEKAEHQGCCGRILPESGRNRNPALDSGTPKTGTKAGMCHLAAHHGGDVCVMCVLIAKSLPRGSYFVFAGRH